MVDRLLSLIALILLAGFCSVLVIYVERIDLTVVVVLVVLLAAIDFFRDTVLMPNKARTKVEPAQQRDQI